uniref:RNA-directed RNA polymerase n=1 Tax=Trichomonas vaginalis virus 2 TaxID=674954 RepID=A0A0K0MNE9_9VIRU|nr:RNA-dependent RNA polymerase [Trichomonas vaginalis virus 2]
MASTLISSDNSATLGKVNEVINNTDTSPPDTSPGDHSNPRLTKILDEMSKKPCVNINEIRKMIRNFQPQIIQPRNGNRPANQPRTVDSFEWVVRIQSTVNTQLLGATNTIPEQTLNLDISFTDDSTTITPASIPGSISMLDNSRHIPAIQSMIQNFKARYLGNLQDTAQLNSPQYPQLLAYLFGQLIAIKDRLDLFRPSNPLSFADALFGFTLAQHAHPRYDDHRHAKACTGPIVIPAATNADCGPCGFVQINANQGLTLPLGACLFVNPETVNDQSFQDFLWLIFATHHRMPNQMQNDWPFALNIVSTCAAPGRQAPQAGQFTEARVKLALDTGHRILLSMFNDDEEALRYYQRKGIETMFRPCCFYTEGGLLRKATRYVSMVPLSGLYYYNGASSYVVSPIHTDAHPGITAAVESFVDIMVLQAVFSFSGPKVVAAKVDANQIDASSVFGPAVAEGDGFVYDPRRPAPPLSAFYTEFIHRPAEQRIFQMAMSQIYGSHAPLIIANVINSIHNCKTKIVNSKLRTAFVRRPPGAPPLKADTAIINRFHDPELAYALGILADGIAPLDGTHEYNILDELDYLFNGGDIRNCFGLNALNTRGLGQIVHVRPKREPGKRPRRGYYTTLDGQVHSVTQDAPLDEIYHWRDHGNLTRPYSCHILDSEGLQFADVSNGRTRGKVLVVVNTPLKTSAAYQGPQLRAKAGQRYVERINQCGGDVIYPRLSTARACSSSATDSTTSTLATQLCYLYKSSDLHRQLDITIPQSYLTFIEWLLRMNPDNEKNSIRHFPNHDDHEVITCSLRNLTKEQEIELFPIKDIIQANRRVNAYARNLLDASPLPDFALQQMLLPKTANDVVCGILLLGEVLWMLRCPISIIVGISRAICRNDSFLKDLSDFNKMLGLTKIPIANCLTELNSLQGRGVTSSDAKRDLTHRIDDVNPHEAKISRENLKQAINNIYREEISKKEVPDTFKQHVFSSPLWVKKGAHHHPHFESYDNRLEFVENVNLDRVLQSHPAVYITQASKLEHGKTRFIYNCDTISYIYFDYILNYIEGVWSNKHVLLNPDYMNPIIFSSLDYSEYCMLDFTDFNSQHSIENMKLVFSCLMPFLPYSMHSVLQWCVTSFDNMYINNIHWKSTLPSGHRATTFINSVLNRAYLLPFLQVSNAFHTGDDVLLCGKADYATLINTAPYELNKTKQSFGPSAEFLRLHKHNDQVSGYPARAISSLVSGNWLSYDNPLWQPSLLSIMQQLYTISARSGLLPFVPVTMKAEVRRRYDLPTRLTNGLFSGEIVPSGCPCYKSNAALLSAVIPDTVLKAKPKHYDLRTLDILKHTSPWINSESKYFDLLDRRHMESSKKNVLYSIQYLPSKMLPIIDVDPTEAFPPQKRYHPRSHIAHPLPREAHLKELRFATCRVGPATAIRLGSLWPANRINLIRPVYV